MTHVRIRALVGLAVAATLCSARVLAQVSEDDRPKLAALPKLFDALGAKPGARIADVGSGDGFYSLQLARRVGPEGSITASDISKESLDRLRSHMETEKVANVDVVLGILDDPFLPAGAFDAVLIRNAYHEMAEYASILSHVRESLKAGGRLVIAEPIREKNRLLSRQEQVAVHQIAPEIVEAELVAAGFEVERRDDGFEPFTEVSNPGGYWLIVATPTKK